MLAKAHAQTATRRLLSSCRPAAPSPPPSPAPVVGQPPPARASSPSPPRPPSASPAGQLPSNRPMLGPSTGSASVASPVPPPSPTPPRSPAAAALPAAATTSATPASSTGWPYSFVSTPAALARLLEAIRALPAPPPDAVLQARHVYLDTEGFELGTAVGKLSIVQLGLPSALAPRAVDVFLVDVLALPAAALRGLWAVLEDASLVKVVWDGKQDFSELLHAEGVELAGVLDLQIAELLGRVRASDRLKAQGTAAVEHRAGWVWSLGGMKRAVDEFKAFAPEERDGAEKLFHAVRAKFDSGGSSAWLDRPLTDDLLQYAALDVYKLAALFPLFHTVRPPQPPPPAGTTQRALATPDDPLLSASTLAEILTVSARSVAVHRPERRAHDDPYHQHAFLPSEVLEPGTGAVRDQPCPGCKRTLRESSWELPMSRVCKTCWAVEKRQSKRRGTERGVYSAGPGARPA